MAKLQACSRSTSQLFSKLLQTEVSERVWRSLIGLYGFLLAGAYLSVTGISISKMANGCLKKPNNNSTFISGRPIINYCTDIGRMGNLTSICSPCDKNLVEKCSIGCADSKYEERKQRFYYAEALSTKHFETDFDQCHPFWKNATINIFPVTHSNWSTGLVVTTAVIAALLNLVVLTFGVRRLIRRAIENQTLLLSTKTRLAKFLQNFWICSVWLVKSGTGHLFSAVTDSVLDAIYLVRTKTAARLIHVDSWVQPIQCVLLILAVIKDFSVVIVTEKGVFGDGNGNTKVGDEFYILVVSLLLEDLGQTGLQVNYYEQFTNKLDALALINAFLMVIFAARAVKKVAIPTFIGESGAITLSSLIGIWFMLSVSFLSFWLTTSRLLLIIDQTIKGGQLIHGDNIELRYTQDGYELWAVNGVLSRSDFLYKIFASLIVTLSVLCSGFILFGFVVHYFDPDFE